VDSANNSNNNHLEAWLALSSNLISLRCLINNNSSSSSKINFSWAERQIKAVTETMEDGLAPVTTIGPLDHQGVDGVIEEVQ
jgi:hypothetical protein